MKKISVKSTPNPAIIKFELEDFSFKNQSFEYKNIDEAENSPLAQQLFYLPFVKTILFSDNFIAIERFSIVEWADVQDEVAQQIENYINQNGIIFKTDAKTKKQPITIYGETTPNPNVLKFVANTILTKNAFEFKNKNEIQISPLAKALFDYDYVKEIFIDENYISITKQTNANWQEITLELRTFIKQFLENGGVVINQDISDFFQEKEKDIDFEKLSEIEQKIVNILEEYVKPAVAADGGSILFESYNDQTKTVKVIMKGACNGCPSSTFTLKSGIESLLKNMLNNNELQVEAVST